MKKNGFTLIEVAIVMVVLGLILGLGIPMMKMLMKQNKLTQNRTAVKEAKEALIGYAYANGKFPKYNGNYQLPYTLLGTRQSDAYGNTLVYDVNNALTSTTSVSDLCKISSISGRPTVDGQSVVFVVISKGSDYKLDPANDTTNGTYENPSHPYNEQTANDIVETYSFNELKKWCGDSGYLDNSSSSGGGGSSGGSSYTSPYAALADQAAKIAEDYPNAPPKASDLSLPNGYSYKKRGKIAILRYKGKRAILRYSRSGVRSIRVR